MMTSNLLEQFYLASHFLRKTSNQFIFREQIDFVAPIWSIITFFCNPCSFITSALNFIRKRLVVRFILFALSALIGSKEIHCRHIFTKRRTCDIKNCLCRLCHNSHEGHPALIRAITINLIAKRTRLDTMNTAWVCLPNLSLHLVCFYF